MSVDRFATALRRLACRKCGSVSGIEEKDGSQCDGMPGITYRVCMNCGHAQPVTKRLRKERL